MKNKRMVIIIMAIILTAFLVAVLYPHFGRIQIENSIYHFLCKDGYTESEISCIEVGHSYINGLLGYGQWYTHIYFTDEPNVEYDCVLSNGILPKVTAIIAGGFSTSLPEDYKPLHYPS